MIEFNNITQEYANIVALDKVSFKIKRGEFICIVGPSGAGKSTIIKLIIREELPIYRRKLGVVFQDFKLLPQKTVYENVAFALEVSDSSADEIREKVPDILENVGMLSKRENFPHELSGGEKQRTAIARALVHDPKILLADEPTGNLDPVNTWEIIELLFKINKMGTMVILATHNKEIVDVLKKRVITLRAGKLVADQAKGKYII